MIPRSPLPGDLDLPPPYRLQGARSLLLAVPCDRAALQSLLDRTFGWALPAIVVEPAEGFVLLLLTDIARATCGLPARGSEAYREAAWFVPVTVRAQGASTRGFHAPFLYPDSPVALCLGREHFGLPKKPARRIVLPPTPTASEPARVTVDAAPDAEGAPWTTTTLLTVTTAAADPWLPLPTLPVFSLDPASPLGRALQGYLSVPVFQRREFLAPDGAKVTTRELVRCSATVDALSELTVGDPSAWALELADLASEPVRATLGLARGTLRPSAVARFTMDFRLGDGAVLATHRRTRVLILGGGLGALATALALTDTPSRRERFAVTVLAQGHRLGGKGASWRNPDAGDRIEEHGIHVIFGFYHNFLRLMRQVFHELTRAPGAVFPATFDEAFSPRWDVAFADGNHTLPLRLPRAAPGWGARAPRLADLKAAAQALLGRSEGLAGGFGQVLKGALTAWLPSSIHPESTLGEQLAEFLTVFARGVLALAADLEKSFDDLDPLDFRAWLRHHGASEALLAGPVVQAPYDAVFAYQGGDFTQPRLAAGLAVRGLLRLALFYDEALYHVMNAGMGECVFAPVYEVLLARGVTVELLRKVRQVEFRGGRARRVKVLRQAALAPGLARYQPLVTVGTTPCWTRRPDPAQLPELAPGADLYSDADASAASEDEYRDGEHYDHVVCALPAPVTARVLTHDGVTELARISRIATVATVQVQTWHTRALEGLGWTPGALAAGGFFQPLNTFLVCDRLLPRERFGPNPPAGLLYACGPWPAAWALDPEDAAARAWEGTYARSQGLDFVRRELGRLLPRGRRAGLAELSHGVFWAPPATPDPVEFQYVRLNIDRSDRYVLALPGSLVDRPRATHPLRPNLHFAGDWTRNGVDIPCMEAAVVSALQVAQGLTGEDLDILGTRDWI
jgi:uncharacterized protein with NAD-binding domain and iron-sulfur cluster